VNSTSLTRRGFLLVSAGSLACGTKKATGFPGYCFVANRDGRSIAVVDLNRFQVRTRIPLDAQPSAIVVQDAAHPRAYALANEPGAVYEIDPERLKVAHRASVARKACEMRLEPAGKALWILARDPAALVRVHLDTLRPAHSIALGAEPESFVLGRDGRAAVSFGNGSLAIVSLQRGSVERVVPGPPPSPVLAFRDDGKVLMAGSASERSLIMYDAADGRPVVRLPLPMAPRHFCVTGDGGQLFVTGDGSDGVTIAFPYLTEIEQTILAGHEPGTMTLTDTSPAYLLVTNRSAGSVTAIDMDSRKLVAVVQVGQQPGAVITTPDNQYALALNERSGELAVIRLSTFAEARVRRYRSAPLFTMIPVGAGPVSAGVLKFQG
jgi:YVTN family beta-propeller protein